MATKNIVPNADSEGQLGTSSKFWSSAYLDGLNIGNDAAANLVFTPSANDTITLAAAANGAFTITTVDTAAAAANVGFVVDGAFDVDAAGAVTIDGVGVAVGSSGAASLITSGAASDIVVTTVHTAGMAFQLNANTNAASEVEINAGILDLNASGNITIDGADDITTTAVDNLSLATSSADGLLLISSAHTAGQAIHIDGNANAGSIVDIDAGILDIDVTAAATIDAVGVAIGAGSGELDLTTTGTMDVNSAALDIDTSGAITIDAAGVASDISISTAHTAGTAFLLDANANAGSIVQVDAGILDLNVTGATTLNGTTTTITSSTADILGLATTHASTGYLEFFYNTSTIAGYLGNGSALGGSATDFVLRSEGGALKFATNANNLALTLDASQNATFAGNLEISNGSPNIFFHTTGNHYNWMIGAQENVSTALEISVDGAVGTGSDTTASNYTPVITALANGNTTFAGKVILSSSEGTALDPNLLITNSGSNAYNHVIDMLAPNLTSGEQAVISLGKAGSTGNTGIIGFKYNGDNNNDSYIALGGWAKGDQFTFKNNGDQTIADGNLVIGTAGHGIDFTAENTGRSGGSATDRTASILDDYEEGTWTAVIKDDAGTAVDTVAETGRYTKIGRIVNVSFGFKVSDKGSVNGATGINVHGLPFAVNTNTQGSGEPHSGHCGFVNNLTSKDYGGGIHARFNNNSTVIELKYTPGGAVTTQGNDSLLFNDIHDSNTLVVGAGTYEVLA